MSFGSVQRWLGFGRDRPIIGLHIHRDLLVVAAVRTEPRRLVAIGRHAAQGSTIGTGSAGRVSALADTLVSLCSELRLPSGAPTVITLEPEAETIALEPEAGAAEVSPAFRVPGGSYRLAAEVAERAGLEVAGLDLVPVSLARLCVIRSNRTSEATDSVAVRDASGWTMVADGRYLDAERRTPAVVDRLQIGPDLQTTAAPRELPGVAVPSRLATMVDLGTDGPAIGAALAGIDAVWSLLIEPTPESPSTGWTATPVGTTGAPLERTNHA